MTRTVDIQIKELPEKYLCEYCLSTYVDPINPVGSNLCMECVKKLSSKKSKWSGFNFDLVEMMILITSSLSILFITSEVPLLVKFASILGLIGQPFWVYRSYQNKSLGIFIVSIIYVISWCWSFWLNWLA